MAKEKSGIWARAYVITWLYTHVQVYTLSFDYDDNKKWFLKNVSISNTVGKFNVIVYFPLVVHR